MEVIKNIQNIKEKLYKSLVNPFIKLSLIHKIFIFFLILVFIVILSNNFNTNYNSNYENFANKNLDFNDNGDNDNEFNPLFKKNFFEIKRGNEVYDDLYSKYYDAIHLDKAKGNYEIGKITDLMNNNKTKTRSNSGKEAEIKVLDVGCGTGYHVNKMNSQFDVVGLDKSEAMIKKANDKYRGCSFIQGDILDNTLELEGFSLITCLNKTIYEFNEREKAKFFENCYSLLKSNGIVVIHLVDRNLFSPFSKMGENSKELFNPEIYGKKANSLIVKFDNDIEYFSNYEIGDGTKESKNKDQEPKSIDNHDVFSVYKEKIKNYKTQSVRKNEISMYMSSIKDIVKIAEGKGFKVFKKINLEPNYKSEYLYVFLKE